LPNFNSKNKIADKDWATWQAVIKRVSLQINGLFGVVGSRLDYNITVYQWDLIFVLYDLSGCKIGGEGRE
jgi:hypothetical protein